MTRRPSRFWPQSQVRSSSKHSKQTCSSIPGALATKTWTWACVSLRRPPISPTPFPSCSSMCVRAKSLLDSSRSCLASSLTNYRLSSGKEVQQTLNMFTNSRICLRKTFQSQITNAICLEICQSDRGQTRGFLWMSRRSTTPKLRVCSNPSDLPIFH